MRHNTHFKRAHSEPVQCLSELSLCHLTVNPSKSNYMRLGPQHDIPNCVIVISGHRQSWSRELKFLGFVIVAGNSFKCKIQTNKQKFYASSNSILGRVDVKDFSHTPFAIIDVFCILVLLYGLKALHGHERCLDQGNSQWCVCQIIQRYKHQLHLYLPTGHNASSSLLQA